LTDGRCIVDNPDVLGTFDAGVTIDFNQYLPSNQCGAVQFDLDAASYNTGSQGGCGAITYVLGTQCTDTPPGDEPPGGETPPPTGPMCLSISMQSAQNQAVSSPQLNDQVKFVCGRVSGVDQYQFRVRKPDGSTTQLSPVNPTANQSELLTIDQPGTYQAQCRICPDGNCQSWESFN
jgi:hypothetical protein